ncbi:hypothetical protein [Tritonibacter mobilis]|uniref:hypothetical protein n=1 Tax=Tritonibacter mobilis TaxID=379347 RepID=UPI000806912B|nr:hypothetical protein [Tritonibacter mobilis]GLP88641.1 hypothetical protein GCM10007921_42040 [Tritonibacter mobilis]SDX74607.1 hypothetical protein SAMN05444385_11260 [Tritonibacter mobilis]
MFTETSEYDAQAKDAVHDLVRLNLLLPRSCLENGTVEMLREAGNHTEEQLRIIGLVEHLVEQHGYLYGAGLIHTLHYSMDFAGNDEEVALKAIDEAVQDLIGAFSRAYEPEVAA